MKYFVGLLSGEIKLVAWFDIEYHVFVKRNVDDDDDDDGYGCR